MTSRAKVPQGIWQSLALYANAFMSTAYILRLYSPNSVSLKTTIIRVARHQIVKGMVRMGPGPVEQQIAERQAQGVSLKLVYLIVEMNAVMAVSVARRGLLNPGESMKKTENSEMSKSFGSDMYSVYQLLSRGYVDSPVQYLFLVADEYCMLG